MKFKILITLLILSIVFVAGCNKASNGVTKETTATTLPKENTVEIILSGFNPETLIVKQGTTVTFVNKDSKDHWPASAVHPTHQLYPGSDISKCGTSEKNMIFDACRGLKSGESWQFTFNEKGSWKYHDHLTPSLRGTIIVE